ncbi:MAG TPA: PKD domain-containing protein [Flavipsychrobacter sp.]|nr:PKD domain-containing protein [Flavipsychrobacter sp.]
MKRVILFLTGLVFFVAGHAQTIISQGTPINPNGWNFSTNAVINIDTVVLNGSLPNESAYTYYATPITITDCARFVGSFYFKISDSAPGGPGDGLAFWFLDNPPAGPVVGNMGMPNAAIGNAFIIDTHDDDFSGNNPLYTMYGLNGSGYNEGLPNDPNRIGPEVPNQNAAINGFWHRCVVIYSDGLYTVEIDGVPVILNEAAPLNTLTGYFGVSASTSANHYSQHAIRDLNVVIDSIETVTLTKDSAKFCLDTIPPIDSAHLAAYVSGDSVIWYNVFGVQLPKPPVVPLDTLGVDTFYVSNYTPCGESTKKMFRLIVDVPPLPPALNYDSTVCVGEAPPNFTLVPNTYWYEDSVGGIGNLNPPVYPTDKADTIIYWVTYNPDGCESKRVAVPLYVLPTPDPDFTWTIKYGCEADTVTFTSTIIGVADSILWTFGDGTSDTARNPVHLYYSQSNNFVVTLIATNKGTGCVDSARKILTNVHPLVAYFTVNDDTVCQGFEVKFTNLDTFNDFGPAHYLWDFGDGTTDTNFSPSHVYNTPGVYTVMHVITDFVPCKDTMFKTIYVDSAGTMVINIENDIICEGAAVTFTGDFTTIGLSNYTWDFGDGFKLQNVNPVTHTYDSGAVYTVTLIGEYRACDDDTAVVALPVQSFLSVNLGPDTVMCPNGAGIVIGDTKNQSVPGAKWLWSTGDSTSSITVRHPGTYTTRVSYNGCMTSDSIEVFKDCYIDIPNSFSPNNDGTNDYFLPRQLLSKSVKKFNMQIFNRWGELVFRTEKLDGRGWDGKFNGKDQPVGVYVYLIDVEIASDSKESFTNYKEHYQGNITLIR